jgi:hypothetical protein
MKGGDFIELVYKFNARAPWVVIDYFKEKLLDSLENGEILPEGQIQISRRQDNFSIFVTFSQFCEEGNGVEELQSALDKISDLLVRVGIVFESPKLQKIDGDYVLEN